MGRKHNLCQCQAQSTMVVCSALEGGDILQLARGTCAMAMAMSASVTVSMGELTTGQDSLILFVSCEPMSTCKWCLF